MHSVLIFQQKCTKLHKQKEKKFNWKKGTSFSKKRVNLLCIERDVFTKLGVRVRAFCFSRLLHLCSQPTTYKLAPSKYSWLPSIAFQQIKAHTWPTVRYVRDFSFLSKKIHDSLATIRNCKHHLYSFKSNSNSKTFNHCYDNLWDGEIMNATCCFNWLVPIRTAAHS